MLQSMLSTGFESQLGRVEVRTCRFEIFIIEAFCLLISELLHKFDEMAVHSMLWFNMSLEINFVH